MQVRNKNRGIVSVSKGEPLVADDVYYDAESGVLVAKFVPGPPSQLLPLASNVTLELDPQGEPVRLDVVLNKSSWGRRGVVEVDLPIEQGRLYFRNFKSYEPISMASAPVASDESGGRVVVTVSDERPNRAVKISPRVVFALAKSSLVSSVWFNDVRAHGEPEGNSSSAR